MVIVIYLTTWTRALYFNVHQLESKIPSFLLWKRGREDNTIRMIVVYIQQVWSQFAMHNKENNLCSCHPSTLCSKCGPSPRILEAFNALCEWKTHNIHRYMYMLCHTHVQWNYIHLSIHDDRLKIGILGFERDNYPSFKRGCIQHVCITFAEHCNQPINSRQRSRPAHSPCGQWWCRRYYCRLPWCGWSAAAYRQP
jgi:hypothetical protein